MNLMNNEKHYNTLNNYYKSTYNKKVFKVALNANFSCPNKQNGNTGCSYCSSNGSGDFAGDKNDDLITQFNKQKIMMHKKWPDAYYIPYLQANSNTYDTLENLKKVYEPLTNLENIVAISIATRPDCLEDDKIKYLGELNKRIKIQVELGLQTIFSVTSNKINRGHSLECFTDAVDKLRKEGIEVVVHIINGLPGETKEMMLETAKFLSKLDIQGVKIHMLHVMYHTKMGIEYLKKPFPLLTLEEYVDITVSQLRLFPKNFIIHRITGDAPRELLIEPKWTLKKLVVSNEIDKYMRKYNYYQGDLYQE